MDVDLRSNDAGEDFSAVGDDCGGRFVARGFDAEYARGHFLILAR
jgi:hypothetical protein